MATPSTPPPTTPQTTEKAPYQVEKTSSGTTAFFMAVMILSFAATFVYLVHIITTSQ